METDKMLVEHIATENSELKIKVGNLTDDVVTLEETKRVLEGENTHMKGEIVKWEDDKKVIESYSVFGTVEEVKALLEKAGADAKVLEEFQKLADTPEAAQKTMEEAKAFIKTVTEDFGTIETIKETFETAVAFRASVDEMGTVEQIKESLESYLKILEDKEATETAETTKALAEELGMEVEKVTELLKKYSAEDIKELRKPASTNEDKDNADLVKTKFNEDGSNNSGITEDDSRILGKSRVDRIAERFIK